jgi:hypothetical protein
VHRDAEEAWPARKTCLWWRLWGTMRLRVLHEDSPPPPPRIAMRPTVLSGVFHDAAAAGGNKAGFHLPIPGTALPLTPHSPPRFAYVTRRGLLRCPLVIVSAATMSCLFHPSPVACFVMLLAPAILTGKRRPGLQRPWALSCQALRCPDPRTRGRRRRAAHRLAARCCWRWRPLAEIFCQPWQQRRLMGGLR